MMSLIMLALLYGFSPAQTTSGDITLSITDIGLITELEQEIPVIVMLANDSPEAIKGTLSIDVIDSWEVVGEPTEEFELQANEEMEIKFVCIAAEGTYAAHYPIHATASIETESEPIIIHTVLVVEVSNDALVKSEEAQQPLLELKSPGRVSLNSLRDGQISFKLGNDGEIMKQPLGWSGTDETTGTNVSQARIDRGDQRSAISVHPPWRKGWGTAWVDYIVQLPNTKPIILDFATAIRDNTSEEPTSDGVQFQVLVAKENSQDYKLLFDRFSDAKRWEEAQVDLIEFSGQKISLRLLTSPGPNNNTTCDQSYWADPVILAGIKPYMAESAEDHNKRIEKSKESAKQALNGNLNEYSRKIQDNIGVALMPGRFGAVDSIIAFATPKGELTIDGFNIEIDGRRIGNWRSGFEIGDWRFDKDTFHIAVKDGEKGFEIAVKTWDEKGGIRFHFGIEGIERDYKGEPRFTNISLGSVDQKVHRLYAGHGNVLEEPGNLVLGYDGFSLSTSFVGFDFANGISLVQATDIPPDSVRINAENGIATLEAHHDLTFTLVPSLDGAFDSARIYREIANLKASPGVKDISGKMCLDQWGGDYGRSADAIEKAARYGLTDSVFVKHVWQRWGYDYRLPDIYPPEGNWDDFMKMVDACKENGILFAPHDNYIDFYPDATGFSYRYIIFNNDGTPQKAWFNEGRKAQSYRWLSHEFQPWMEDNLDLIKYAFSPNSYFIDVFSAITPMDYYDRKGNFYPKMISIQSWGEAFDRVREVFDGALTISEAGHDALIGHLDCAQADHIGWTPENQSWSWNVRAKDGERIPWHDMVTHGKFVLLAGGLGSRYSGSETRELHGYGSDDYLGMTVLGGRNPMCDGPFNRDAVMTYWLLHDISDDLARQDMIKHKFAEDDIHRQIVDFSAGKVIANRGETDWQIDDNILPSYGFIAESAHNKAMVTKRNGITSAYAESPDAIFVDARPPERFGGLPINVEILGIESLGGRKFALMSKWTIQSSVNETGRTFIHFTNRKVSPNGENIAFQAQFPITSEQWNNPGVYEIRTESELPEGLPLDEYGIRFGIYQPELGGRRFRLVNQNDSTDRSVGGSIAFNQQADGSLSMELKPAPPDDRFARINLERKIVDFGVIETNGAFRLLKNEKMIMPLPESQSFEITLDLKALNLPTVINHIEALNENLEKQEDIEFSIDNGRLHFITKPDIFAYRLAE